MLTRFTILDFRNHKDKAFQLSDPKCLPSLTKYAIMKYVASKKAYERAQARKEQLKLKREKEQEERLAWLRGDKPKKKRPTRS